MIDWKEIDKEFDRLERVFKELLKINKKVENDKEKKTRHSV
jgi:hypothetical protein